MPWVEAKVRVRKPFSCAHVGGNFARRRQATVQPHEVNTPDNHTTDCVVCADKRTLVSTLALVTGSLLICNTAQALPLAPLGRGSDTIGGPKLQNPSLKQVQVVHKISTLALPKSIFTVSNIIKRLSET